MQNRRNMRHSKGRWCEMIHQLKIESKYFVQIMTGVKTFEVRFNDRDFHAGDYLGLNEITDHQCNDKGERKETGRFLLVRVLNVFDNPVFVKDGYVIMSIAPCKIIEPTKNYALAYDENSEV